MIFDLNSNELAELIVNSIKEDIGSGDITSNACFSDKKIGKAFIKAKQNGIVCGLEIVKSVFKHIDKSIKIKNNFKDGNNISVNDIVINFEGDVKNLLIAERVALNFLQHLSGISTITYNLTQKIKHTKAKILDTRKTTPCFRNLEKYAVFCGGGMNHRFGLYDAFLIKDNHIDFTGGIVNAIKKIESYKKNHQLKNIECIIEVRDIEQLNEVLNYNSKEITRIMLDNFICNDVKKAVSIISNKYKIEVSGGINENNIVEYAETGIDYISIGYLTHSAKALDFSMLVN